MTKLGSQSVPTAVGHRKPLRSFRLVYTVSMAWTLAPLAAKRVRLRQSWKTSKYSPAPRILNDAPGQKIPKGVSERLQLETEGWKSSEKYPKDLHIFHHISKLTIFQIIIIPLFWYFLIHVHKHSSVACFKFKDISSVYDTTLLQWINARSSFSDMHCPTNWGSMVAPLEILSAHVTHIATLEGRRHRWNEWKPMVGVTGGWNSDEAPSLLRLAPSSAERSSAPQVIASTRGCLAISLARNGASGTSLTMGSTVVAPTSRPSFCSTLESFSPNFSRSSRLETLGTTNISGFSAFMVISTSSSHSWVSKGLIRTHTVLSPQCVDAIHFPTSALAAGFSAGKTESSKSMISASAREARALSRNFWDPPGTKCKLLSRLAARRRLRWKAMGLWWTRLGSEDLKLQTENEQRLTKDKKHVKHRRTTTHWMTLHLHFNNTSTEENVVE